MGLLDIFRSKGVCDIAKPLQLHEIKNRAKILIIDDRPDSLPVEFLEAEGYTIDVWKVVKTLDQIERGRWHVIILDISGVAKEIDGDDDGFIVLKHIKANDPSQLIIACSAEQFDATRHEFFSLADDVLKKPVTASSIKEKLDRQLRRKFDPAYLWGEASDYLRTQGLASKDIQRLEKMIVKAANGGALPDLKQAFKDQLSDKAVAITIGSVEAIVAMMVA